MGAECCCPKLQFKDSFDIQIAIAVLALETTPVQILIVCSLVCLVIVGIELEEVHFLGVVHIGVAIAGPYTWLAAVPTPPRRRLTLPTQTLLVPRCMHMYYCDPNRPKK